MSSNGAGPFQPKFPDKAELVISDARRPRDGVVASQSRLL